MAHHYVDAHNNNRANIAYLPLGTTYQSMIEKRDANFSRDSVRPLSPPPSFISWTDED